VASRVISLQATGFRFWLEPRNGDVFLGKLMPTAQFGHFVERGSMKKGFACGAPGQPGRLVPEGGVAGPVPTEGPA